MKYFYTIIFALGVTAGLVINYSHPQAKLGGGSVQGGAYQSTTTSQAMVTATGFQLLRSGPGILGSIVITNSSAFPFAIYDATTTTTTGPNYATTTLAKFGASAAAGTYIFDAAFTKGLIIEYTGQATLASTTVTWQ